MQHLRPCIDSEVAAGVSAHGYTAFLQGVFQVLMRIMPKWNTETARKIVAPAWAAS